MDVYPVSYGGGPSFNRASDSAAERRAILAVQRPMRATWIAALLLLSTGCAPMQWARPDASPEQVQADAQQCSEGAWRQVNSDYLAYRAFGPWMSRDAFDQPFVFHPVGPFYDPYTDRHMEEQRLANLCMRAKGYDLAPERK